MSTNDKPSPASFHLSFDGKLLARGFWLYVWEITPPEGEKLYYVGRTGDNASPFAQSPFNRMGQHLGSNKANNVLRGHLQKIELNPESCHFRLIAHGPIFAENKSEHWHFRDKIAALEKALADAFKSSGYKLLNSVHAKKELDEELFSEILNAFAVEFPNLTQNLEAGKKEKRTPINIDEDTINANWIKLAGFNTKGFTREQLLRILHVSLEEREALVDKIREENQ